MEKIIQRMVSLMLLGAGRDDLHMRFVKREDLSEEEFYLAHKAATILLLDIP